MQNLQLRSRLFEGETQHRLLHLHPQIPFILPSRQTIPYEPLAAHPPSDRGNSPTHIELCTSPPLLFRCVEVPVTVCRREIWIPDLAILQQAKLPGLLRSRTTYLQTSWLQKVGHVHDASNQIRTIPITASNAEQHVLRDLKSTDRLAVAQQLRLVCFQCPRIQCLLQARLVHFTVNVTVSMRLAAHRLQRPAPEAHLSRTRPFALHARRLNRRIVTQAPSAPNVLFKASSGKVSGMIRQRAISTTGTISASPAKKLLKESRN